MGRSYVHRRQSTKLRLALKCAAVMLPALLCACRQHQTLVDDLAYQISPQHMHLDRVSNIDTDPRISAADLMMAPEPPRLADRKEIIHWDMTLQDVIFHALENSKIIRRGGEFLSPNNSLLRSPDGVSTVYDRAIQSTGVLFGQRGEQAALSEFDSQFTTRMLWGNSSTIQNARNTGLIAGTALKEDTAQFQSSLQKALYSGGQIGVSHSWNYSSNNNSVGRLFPSVYEGNLRAEFRQPLLAGAGSQYSMIAGPISENIQGVTGVQQGILISRINNLIAIADFELDVINYLRDVELQYWKLHLAYQTHQTRQDTLADAQRILGMVEARQDAPGGELARIVEAREGVLQAEQGILESLDGIYTNESQLRLLMGFSLQSEKMIHPIDKPLDAAVKHDWSSSLGSALSRRPELRRQKESVHSAELQLIAAENLNRPRLDLLASGQTNGFGDNLIGSRSTDRTTQRIGNAYDRLVRGNETGWNLGVEYSQPIGLRFASEQVKNHELKVAKAKRLLEAQEAEILHELTAAFQAVDRTYIALQTQVSLVKNAEDRMTAAEADYNSNREGRSYLDLDALNRARNIYAETVIKEGQARLEYSMSLTDIEYRCGRLLDYHHVTLSGSPEAAMRISVQTAAPFVLPPQGVPPLTPPAKIPAESVKPTPESAPQPVEVDDEFTIIDRAQLTPPVASKIVSTPLQVAAKGDWKPNTTSQPTSVEPDTLTDEGFQAPILLPPTESTDDSGIELNSDPP